MQIKLALFKTIATISTIVPCCSSSNPRSSEMFLEIITYSLESEENSFFFFFLRLRILKSTKDFRILERLLQFRKLLYSRFVHLIYLLQSEVVCLQSSQTKEIYFTRIYFERFIYLMALRTSFVNKKQQHLIIIK